MVYLTAHASDFANLDWSALPLERTDQGVTALFAGWQRLNDYVALRDSLPQGKAALIDVFAATSLEDRLPTLQLGSSGAAVIALQHLLNGLTVSAIFDQPTSEVVIAFQQSHGLPADGIVAATTWQAIRDAAPQPWQTRMEKTGKEDALVSATGWDALTIDRLAGVNHLNFNAADFTTEIALARLQTCVRLLNQIGVSADQLFRWATNSPDSVQANAIAKTVKAKYDDETWLMVGKSLNDELRESQRSALLAYILADFQDRRPGDQRFQPAFRVFPDRCGHECLHDDLAHQTGHLVRPAFHPALPDESGTGGQPVGD